MKNKWEYLVGVGVGPWRRKRGKKDCESRCAKQKEKDTVRLRRCVVVLIKRRRNRTWCKSRKIRIRGIIGKRGSFVAGSVSVGSSSVDRFLLISVCRRVFPPYGAEWDELLTSAACWFCVVAVRSQRYGISRETIVAQLVKTHTSTVY
jgi:hypothetical protein